MPEDVKGDPPPADLRAGRVARTEAALVSAARELFVEQGYVATTLAQVARRAGVSDRTVYVRFGTKAALFQRVVGLALAGDDDPDDVAHRPRTRDAMTLPTLRQRIEALADVGVGIAERAGPLFEVAAQAEAVEPELAEAAQAGRLETARLATEFWHRAEVDGLLPASADRAALSLVTDVLVCADTTVHLRRAHGWSAGSHRTLIVDTLIALTHRQPGA